LFAPRIYIVVNCAHPVRGESHNQRNVNGEVATVPVATAKMKCWVCHWIGTVMVV